MAPTCGIKTKCSAERINHWTQENKDSVGNPISVHDRPTVLFDSLLLAGMLLGVISVIFQAKILAWVALFLSCNCLGNYRGPEDFRQIGTSFIVSISSLAMLYMRDPSPIEW